MEKDVYVIKNTSGLFYKRLDSEPWHSFVANIDDATKYDLTEVNKVKRKLTKSTSKNYLIFKI